MSLIVTPSASAGPPLPPSRGCVVPQLAYAVQTLSQFSSNPGPEHMTALFSYEFISSVALPELALDREMVLRVSQQKAVSLFDRTTTIKLVTGHG